ncbi:DUF1328 family protein [Tropicimonas sp. IMCC34011]|uniref:DUF1328 family protein n=1 Tax=Tropicimonas sp. IMCC34011 TaxID=2248759 RepID=UPI0018E579A8|nr:DUF1328 family protein [Tropicimonas sp. IMCC34011]
MRFWALVFLGLAVICAIFGYSGASGEATEGIARILATVFAMLCVLTLAIQMMNK